VFDVAGHILVLHFGEVLEAGTPVQIRSSRKVQDIYLGAG
jgi:ABC-type branched-subunit amino acid transport system ATPase component